MFGSLFRPPAGYMRCTEGQGRDPECNIRVPLNDGPVHVPGSSRLFTLASPRRPIDQELPENSPEQGTSP